MKKSNKSHQEDHELHRFFDELKDTETKEEAPDLELLLYSVPERERKAGIWPYAAAVALLVVGLGASWSFYKAETTPTDMTEIIISYESPEVRTEDPLKPLGMDQWQSETDILLTGL